MKLSYLIQVISLLTSTCASPIVPEVEKSPLIPQHYLSSNSPVLASPDDFDKFPHHDPDKDLSPIEKAAKRARHLVHFSNLATVNTIYQHGDRKGIPVGQIEYYSDCIGEEDPDQPLTFIGLNISTVFRNVNDGSPVSLSIRLGDTSPLGLTPISPAASPRISLFGEFIPHEGDKELAKKCFLRSHHDAHAWLPGNEDSPHSTYWLKFNITGIHYIGGFGDKAYIGDIPVELYRNVTIGRRDDDKHQHKINPSQRITNELKDWIQMGESIHGVKPRPRRCSGSKKSNLAKLNTGGYFKHAKHSSKHPDHNEHKEDEDNSNHNHMNKHSSHKCGNKNKLKNWWHTRLTFIDKVKALFFR